MLKDIKPKEKDMRCNDIARGGGKRRGEKEREGSIEAQTRMYAASRTWHRSSSISRAFGFRRAGKIPLRFSPPLVRQMYRRRSRLSIAREKFSCWRNDAIRHRDSVKSNVENAFTRDRVHSSLDLRPHPRSCDWRTIRFRLVRHRASDRSVN